MRHRLAELQSGSELCWGRTLMSKIRATWRGFFIVRFKPSRNILDAAGEAAIDTIRMCSGIARSDFAETTFTVFLLYFS